MPIVVCKDCSKEEELTRLGARYRRVNNGSCNSCSKRGKKRFFSKEHRDKISKANSGERSHLWKGGITKENHKIRTSREYKAFVRECLVRDGFTCQLCKHVGGDLEVHHIKPFATHKSLRTDINNGITLCKTCHASVDKHRKLKS